jgi:hypothetical protein
MVSWLRSMTLHWDAFESEFGLAEAAVVQTRMKAIRDAESPLDAWEEWLLSVEEAPGVLMVATATNPVHGPSPNREDGARQGERRGEPEADYLVSFLHHLKPGEGQEIFLGFGSLNPADNRLVCVDWDDMLQGLVSSDKHERTRKTTSERNARLVPTMRGLISGDHPVDEPFAASEGLEFPSVGSLSDWPRAVFVPVPVLELMMSKDEETNYPSRANGRGVDPSTLIHRLLRRLRRLDAEVIDQLEIAITEVLIFLWAVTNRLNEGTILETAEASRYTLRHVADCMDELIGPTDFQAKFSARNPPARDAYEVEDEEGGHPKEAETGAGRGDERGPTAAPNAASRGMDTSVRRPNERAQLPPFPTGPRAVPPTGHGLPPTGLWEELIKSMASSNYALASAGRSLNEFATASKDSIAKKESKTSATSKWLDSGVFIFRFLCGPDGWRTSGVPDLTPFAVKLMDMKIFQATQLIRDKAEEGSWPGGILKSGMSNFLKRGFVAENIHVEPTGFSVLYFHPSSYVETDSEEFRMQQVREAHGDGELGEEMIKAFNKLQIFVPENAYKAADQIKVAVKFLECLCGDKTVATEGYTTGLSLLERHHAEFERAGQKSKLFLLNYLYLLDRVFQSFCKEVRKFSDRTDPVLDCNQGGRLEGWMGRRISQTMADMFTLGITPLLTAPLALEGNSPNSEGLLDLSHKGGRPS